MTRLLRSVALGLMLLVLGLALLTWRAVTEGEAAMLESDAAFNQGELRRSVLHARRAATAFAPGAPHVEHGYARLQAVAIGAEARGDLDIAEEAWRAVRSAALETRSIWTPRATELDRANRALARLATRKSDDPAQREAALKELEQDLSPRPRWILVLGLGFALTAAGLVWLILRGVDRAGAVNRRQLAIGASLALSGVVCWTMAVWLA